MGRDRLMREVSLVIPAYNEAARLPELLTALATSAADELGAAGLHLLEVVIVDDGSTDTTAEVLRDAATEMPLLAPVLGRRRNLGKGAAIKAGIEAARAELVLLVDVDLSTPLTDAARLAEALGEDCAIAIGSRSRSSDDVVAPRHRRILGAAFNVAVRAVTGLRHADTQSGFKLLEREVARALVDDQICAGFAFDVELLLRAQRAGLQVAEVPVSYRHDRRSKVRVVQTSGEMARDLLRLRRRLNKRDDKAELPTPRLEDAGRG